MDHFKKTGDSGSSGISRSAQTYGSNLGSLASGQIAYSSPNFYSPLHTATNWQIPTKRREIYIWCRFFSQNDPTIKSSLRFYSQFPFHGYEHVMSDPIRKEHFDNLKKRLRLERLIPMVAYEYFAMGDAFPFISFECARCSGFGMTPDGNICNHEGGRIANVTCLDPNWVDVQINPLMPLDPIINLIPDDTLKQIVWSKKPPEIYEKIPDRLKKLILENKPIPLSNRSISHLKHDEVPYMAYGNSILLSLFPILAYQDRLRQAQWIVAERHILPIKICKIGSDNRPASSADISDTQRLLTMSANDPNMTLVAHHNFEYEWVGASGKVLQLTKEYELIDQAIVKGLGVNEALLSGCIPDYSRIMTDDGFKTLDEFDQNKHKVATLNPETHKIEMQYATYTHVYDYNSIDGIDPPLVHFKNKDKLDNLFTTGHEMYVKKSNSSEYKKVRADKIEHKDKFILKTEGWDGEIPENIDDLTLGIPLEEFLKQSSLFIKEEEEFFGCCFRQNSIELTNKFIDYFGKYQEKKRIPTWIKNLPSKYLEILIYNLNNCDEDNEKKANKYYTLSRILCSDLCEILLKLKQSPRFYIDGPNPYFNLYVIEWSSGIDIVDYPEIINNDEIKSIYSEKYKGEVWCVTVPNHIVLFENEGKMIWAGNSGPSYSQAAIGIEATIKRLRTVQNIMEEWICEKIYRQEAIMQGFYKKNLSGEKELDYPEIRWSDLNLRDETQKQQLYMQMWDKQLVSSQFIHEKFDIDHETETERIRMEQAYQMQLGIAPGGDQGGGGGGGLGGLGGGKPGGLGGGFSGPKGNLPGGHSGPGLPGDSNAPSMSGGAPPPGGGGMPPSGGGPMAAYETQLKNYNKAQEYAPTVSRKQRIQEPKMPRMQEPEVNDPEFVEVPRSGALSLTDIEIILYKKVEEAQKMGHLPLSFLWQQYPEPNDPETSRIIVDGMFPDIKLIVEADGKKWHSSPEDIQRDNERDMKLNARGWTILRFTEDEIKYSIEEVIKKIIRTVEELNNYYSPTNVQSNIKKPFIHKSYDSGLCYKEKIAQYKQEEFDYRIYKESQKKNKPNIEENTEKIEKVTEKEEINKKESSKENQLDEMDKSFLRTSKKHEIIDELDIEETISEDLSEEEPLIEDEQEKLRNLIE
jgi:hypothetical protein